MYTDEDATLMMKIVGLWKDRKWDMIRMLIGMEMRCRKSWHSKVFIEEMELMEGVAKCRK